MPPSGVASVILFGVVYLATLKHFTTNLAFKSILESGHPTFQIYAIGLSGYAWGAGV